MIEVDIYFSGSSLANVDGPPTAGSLKDGVVLKLLWTVQHCTVKNFISPITATAARPSFTIKLKVSNSSELIKVIFKHLACLSGFWQVVRV